MKSKCAHCKEWLLSMFQVINITLITIIIHREHNHESPSVKDGCLAFKKINT